MNRTYTNTNRANSIYREIEFNPIEYKGRTSLSSGCTSPQRTRECNGAPKSLSFNSPSVPYTTYYIKQIKTKKQNQITPTQTHR